MGPYATLYKNPQTNKHKTPTKQQKYSGETSVLKYKYECAMNTIP